MLTPEQLDNFPDNLVRLYSQAELDIIRDIARRISTYDFFIPSAEFQYKKLIEMGNIHEEVLQTLSQMTPYTKKELEKLMEDAGAKSIRADDEIYEQAGLKPTPLGQSPALLDVLNAGINNTNGLFENLTRTTARTASKQFENILDRAYMQITTGAFDYNTAIRSAIKDLARNGIAAIEYPNGHINYIESAVRRAVITGVNQTALKMQDARADEMGSDLVETSAHAGARPSHANWQGKIFSRSGNHPKYPNFKLETGYGTGAGLGGWNCRHSYYVFIEGISKPAYTKSELKDMNAKTIEYNGQKLTEYEASQKQRAIERKIRAWKREAEGMGAAGFPNDEALSRVSYWQARQRDFIEQTGLKRQPEREQIKGRNSSGKVNPEPANKMLKETKIPDIINKEEEVVNKTLHEVETSRQNINYEVGTVIDRQGNILNVTHGKEHSVNPPEELLSGNIFTHNHPNGSLFSIQDIESFIQSGLYEVRASTPQGTFCSLKQGDLAGINKGIVDAAHAAKVGSYIKAVKDIEEGVKKGRWTIKYAKEHYNNLLFEVMDEHIDSWLTENAPKFGYIFTKGEI